MHHHQLFFCLIKQLQVEILTEKELFVTNSSTRDYVPTSESAPCVLTKYPETKAVIKFRGNFAANLAGCPDSREGNKGAWFDPSVSGSGHPKNLRERWWMSWQERRHGAFTGCQLGYTLQHWRETHLCIHVVIFIALLTCKRRIISSIQGLTSPVWLSSWKYITPMLVRWIRKNFRY